METNINRSESTISTVHPNAGWNFRSKVIIGFCKILLAELLGTALLILVGLSVVIIDFGRGSPVMQFLPDAGFRRLVTGFLFGTTGARIATSPLGKISGAHINPVVTMAFWLRKKMSFPNALAYIIAQLIGASLGALPLLLWGDLGRSVEYGATIPGANYGLLWAVAGEVVTTCALIAGLFSFLGHKEIRAYTPLLFPFLYALMVYVEAPISGTSTNPARSFGPSLVSGEWRSWWLYWIGPILGMALALLVHRARLFGRLEITVAKIYHFKHDPYEIFKKRS